MGRVDTIGETDFIWFDDVPEGITHALLFDAVGADHMPGVVAASLVEDTQPIGHITSKHVHSVPHTLLKERGFVGWSVFRVGHALIIEISTPARLSDDVGQQKNAWLFNYPPARDIARMLADLGVETFTTLTTSLFDEHILSKEVADGVRIIPASQIGNGDEDDDTLQPLWGWLPAFVFERIKGGAEIMLMPAHGPSVQAKPLEETSFEVTLEALKDCGFPTQGAIERGKNLYEMASYDAAEAAKMANEVMSKLRRQKKSGGYEGGMFG